MQNNVVCGIRSNYIQIWCILPFKKLESDLRFQSYDLEKCGKNCQRNPDWNLEKYCSIANLVIFMTIVLIMLLKCLSCRRGDLRRRLLVAALLQPVISTRSFCSMMIFTIFYDNVMMMKTLGRWWSFDDDDDDENIFIHHDRLIMLKSRGRTSLLPTGLTSRQKHNSGTR